MIRRKKRRTPQGPEWPRSVDDGRERFARGGALPHTHSSPPPNITYLSHNHPSSPISPRHSRLDRESLPRLPPFAELPHHCPCSRQTAAHRHAPGGPGWPTAVRHRPISAPGAPQPSAQRTEWPLPCACLAERAPRRFLRSLPLGRNDKVKRSVDLRSRHRSVEMRR